MPKESHTSCSAIKEANPSAKSGTYWLAPSRPGFAPKHVYCDMVRDGGGWALVAKWDGSSDDHSDQDSVNSPRVLEPTTQSASSKYSDETIRMMIGAVEGDRASIRFI